MDTYNIVDVENAYVAGIIDGEGNISMKKDAGYYNLSVAVTNTDKEVLEFIANKFGKNIFEIGVRKGRKRCFRWIIGGEPAVKMLERLLPYFIIKKKQAMIGIRTYGASIKEKYELGLEMAELNK